MQDLVDAGVDFTITGQQMYFPYRDLQDTIILIERLEKFGRPVQLTEIGASSGPTKDSINTGQLGMPPNLMSGTAIGMKNCRQTG